MLWGGLGWVRGRGVACKHKVQSAPGICLSWAFGCLEVGNCVQPLLPTCMRHNSPTTMRHQETRQQMMNDIKALCDAPNVPGLINFYGAFHVPDSGQVGVVP